MNHEEHEGHEENTGQRFLPGTILNSFVKFKQHFCFKLHDQVLRELRVLRGGNEF